MDGRGCSPPTFSFFSQPRTRQLLYLPYLLPHQNERLAAFLPVTSYRVSQNTERAPYFIRFRQFMIRPTSPGLMGWMDALPLLELDLQRRHLSHEGFGGTAITLQEQEPQIGWHGLMDRIARIAWMGWLNYIGHLSVLKLPSRQDAFVLSIIFSLPPLLTNKHLRTIVLLANERMPGRAINVKQPGSKETNK